MIDWAVTSKALTGQTRSGDLHVVKDFPGGVLLAAVDGLGHGDEAGRASDIAAATLEAHPDEPVDALVLRCHQRLQGTRGVAMTVASIHAADQTVRWLGIGNVEGVLIRSNGTPGNAHEGVMLRGGVVGYSLPPLRVNVFPVWPGDTLILATDGVRPGFADRPPPGESPRQTADRILARFGRGTDDALVLVARVRERAA